MTTVFNLLAPRVFPPYFDPFPSKHKAVTNPCCDCTPSGSLGSSDRLLLLFSKIRRETQADSQRARMCHLKAVFREHRKIEPGAHKPRPQEDIIRRTTTGNKGSPSFPRDKQELLTSTKRRKVKIAAESPLVDSNTPAA